MKIQCFFVFWVVLSCSANAFGSQGRALDVLQKIQGGWRLACHPSETSLGYQELFLKVTFTHFGFQQKKYSDPECTKLQNSNQARYRFVLRDAVVDHKNQSAFLIHFSPELETPNLSLPLFNLIQYASGTLLLGDSDSLDAQGQVSTLDRTRVYRR